MKRSTGITLAVALMMICGYASAFTLAQYNYWHFTLSQSKRNSAILTAAYSQLGATGRCNCYTWASEMVSNASAGVMQLPPPVPGSDSTLQSNVWVQSRSYTTKAGTIPAIVNASVGQVVQMRTLSKDGTWGPHTAIIHHFDVGGVTFINANYDPKCQVALYRMTWAYFNSHVTNYSIYVMG